MTTTITHALAAAALCAAPLLGGCGGTDGAADDPTEAPMSSTSPSSAPGADTPQARAATADLADHLGVDQDEIAVVAVEAVTWRDGSLGCAEPGTMYTQALVEGVRITLAADGAEYEYHAGGQRGPFRCEKPTQ